MYGLLRLVCGPERVHAADNEVYIADHDGVEAHTNSSLVVHAIAKSGKQTLIAQGTLWTG